MGKIRLRHKVDFTLYKREMWMWEECGLIKHAQAAAKRRW